MNYMVLLAYPEKMIFYDTFVSYIVDHLCIFESKLRSEQIFFKLLLRGRTQNLVRITKLGTICSPEGNIRSFCF